MKKDRDWMVLLIGGASGTGKSSFAYELARFYGVNVLEVDDIVQTLEAMTTSDVLPVIHYWSTGINWREVGIDRNVNWLIDVSKELIPGLKAIVDRHIEDKVPVIIEGDFIHPEFAASFKNPEVKSLFVQEPDKKQILQNYFAREGGDLQHFRADISAAYEDWLSDTCRKLGIRLIEARPWDTALDRAIERLL